VGDLVCLLTDDGELVALHGTPVTTQSAKSAAPAAPAAPASGG